VYSGKVALPGGMLGVCSVVAVAIHSASSFAASARWVSASEAMTIASEIEGAAFALASMAGSSVVA
jgi:hypothetical protein